MLSPRRRLRRLVRRHRRVRPAGTSAPSAIGGHTSRRVARGRPATSSRTALAPLRAASAFETRVDLGGATVVSVKGRTVGDASRLTVTNDGKAVEYIEIPPKAWAREPKGKWVLVAAEQAPALAARRPGSSRSTWWPIRITPGPGRWSATYPAAALGSRVTR